MSKKRVRIPPAIEQALTDTGLPYEITPGAKHQKIILAGQFVGILPLDGYGNDSGRGRLNLISQIRRAARA
jgi:hypothetical protein